MSQTNVLVFVAGAALTASAFAQNANLDRDRAYQAELLADASARTSALNEDAGYKGVFSISDGGANRLNIGGTVQTRYNHSFRDEDAVGQNNDFTHGFSNGSVRLRTWGTIWDPALAFKISGNFNQGFSDSGSFALEDAFGIYSFEGGTSLKWGQFKLPLVREVNIEDEFQLAIGRSVTSQLFSQGYSQGLQLGYASDQFRVGVAFSDGASTANTSFDSANEADYALTLRVDFLAMGNEWERFNDFTSWQSAPGTALLIGGGVHFQDGGETGGTSDTQVLVYTIDAAFEGEGYNVFAAFYGSNVDAGGGDSDTFGGVIQGGIFVADQVEVFARGEGIFFDDTNAPGADEEVFFANAGVNYYISPESHAAKFTGQVGYAFNDTSGLFGTGGLVGTDSGFLGQAEDGEITIGFQMQLMF